MIAALVAIASALALALVIVVVAAMRARRSAAERLGRVVHQFVAHDDERPRPAEADIEGYKLDDWLTYLESVATTAAMTANLVERDRARWQLAMDELAIGVVLVDEDGTVCASNALADEMMSARDAMALVGAGVRELLEQAGAGHARFRTVKLTGPPPRVIEIGAHPVSSDSHALGAVAVIADRTEGARVDEVRRDFVANLSHELRTPVGAIALLSETLEHEDDPAVRARLVDRISVETERVRLIIDDLLELSRVELEGSMRQEPVAIVPLLGEVAHQYSEHARLHDVELVRPEPSNGTAIKLHADRGQLLRAVGNLVDNAIKYSDPGAEVHLSVLPSSGHDRPPTEVLADADAAVARIGPGDASGSSDSPAPPGGPALFDPEQSDAGEPAWVDIVVADEGIGIPADETERVFERFYRVDKARARATGGTGLGLSIVRHVVANHGGEVMLHTREGVGTTFTLRFPAPDDSVIFDKADT